MSNKCGAWHREAQGTGCTEVRAHCAAPSWDRDSVMRLHPTLTAQGAGLLEKHPRDLPLHAPGAGRQAGSAKVGSKRGWNPTVGSEWGNLSAGGSVGDPSAEGSGCSDLLGGSGCNSNGLCWAVQLKVVGAQQRGS